MDGRKLDGGSSNMAVLLRKETIPPPPPPPPELLESFWIPDSSATFHGNLILSHFFCSFSSVSWCWVDMISCFSFLFPEIVGLSFCLFVSTLFLVVRKRRKTEFSKAFLLL